MSRYRVRPKIVQIVDLLSMGGAQKLIVTFAIEAQTICVGSNRDQFER